MFTKISVKFPYVLLGAVIEGLPLHKMVKNGVLQWEYNVNNLKTLESTSNSYKSIFKNPRRIQKLGFLWGYVILCNIAAQLRTAGGSFSYLIQYNLYFQR